MHNLPKVEFRQRAVPASAEKIAQRTDVVRRLDDLDYVDAVSGAVNTTEMQWCARIGDTEFVVLDFGVQKLDGGEVAISLVAVADVVSIGESAAEADVADPATAEAERHRIVVNRLQFAENAGAGTGQLTAESATSRLATAVNPEAATA